MGNKVSGEMPGLIITGNSTSSATVRRIIAAYGGKIRAESEGPGKGTTFTFTPPMSPDVN